MRLGLLALVFAFGLGVSCASSGGEDEQSHFWCGGECCEEGDCRADVCLAPVDGSHCGDAGAAARDAGGAPAHAFRDAATVEAGPAPPLATADPPTQSLCASRCDCVGWEDCNDDPSDGCETNLVGDGDHCGACGVGCGADACVAGACGGRLETLAIGDDGFRACALRAGEVWCWGAGSTLATKVDGITDVVVLVVEFYHTCALRVDATVWCWGGYAEEYSIAWPPTPTVVPGVADAVAIWEDGGAPLGGRTCALLADGNVRCIRNGEPTPPGSIPAGPVVDRKGLCALLRDGTVACEGEEPLAAFSKISGISGAVAIASVGLTHAALLLDGTVHTWTLAIDSGSAMSPRTPVEVAGLANVVDLTGGPELCALDEAGSVWCWSDVGGALRRVAAEDRVFEYVAGAGAACVLRAAGQTQCSGPTGLVGEVGVDPGGFVDVPGLPAP